MYIAYSMYCLAISGSSSRSLSLKNLTPVIPNCPNWAIAITRPSEASA